MCNLYGLLIACPAFPYERVVAHYSLDYSWGRLKDPLTLWLHQPPSNLVELPLFSLQHLLHIAFRVWGAQVLQ
jgi:hypothetical protein